MPVFDVAVVGLGAMGSAALYHLSRRGRRVIGIERARPGHDGGSSHGESRIIRLAYFEHPSYVPLLRRAYENWRNLERESGTDLLTITGILEAGFPGSGLVAGSLAAARLHDLPHEILSSVQAASRFPAFRFPADWQVVFQPNGGFVHADRAIEAMIAGARRQGADIRLDTAVRALEPRAGGVRVTLAEGEVIEAGAAIVAAGAWIADLCPQLGPCLTLTRQVLGWFEPVDRRNVQPDRFPVFLFESPEDTLYGFPDFAGAGVKAASHLSNGLLARAGSARQDASAADAARIMASLSRYVPGAAGPMRAMKTCTYTRTPDEDFVLGPHPAHPEIVLCSSCSGHGFKFASVIGEILADLATSGATPHDIGRFAVNRVFASA